MEKEGVAKEEEEEQQPALVSSRSNHETERRSALSLATLFRERGSNRDDFIIYLEASTQSQALLHLVPLPRMPHCHCLSLLASTTEVMNE